MVGGHHLVPFVLPDGLDLLDRAELGRGAYGDLGRLGSQDVVADRNRERRPRRDRAVARSRVEEHGIPGEALHDDLDRGLGGSSLGPVDERQDRDQDRLACALKPQARPQRCLDQGANPPRPPRPQVQDSRRPRLRLSPRAARPGQGLEHPPLVELQLQYRQRRRVRPATANRPRHLKGDPHRTAASRHGFGRRSLHGRPQQEQA